MSGEMAGVTNDVRRGLLTFIGHRGGRVITNRDAVVRCTFRYAVRTTVASKQHISVSQSCDQRHRQHFMSLRTKKVRKFM